MAQDEGTPCTMLWPVKRHNVTEKRGGTRGRGTMHHVIAGEAAQNNGKNDGAQEEGAPCTMLWPAKRHRITVKTKWHKRKGHHAPCYGRRSGAE